MGTDVLLSVTVVFVLWPAPVYVPLAFLAYAYGRRQFSLKVLLAFMTLESVAIGLFKPSFSALGDPPPDLLRALVVASSVSMPIWLPAVGLAFACGRRFYDPGYFLFLALVSGFLVPVGCGIGSMFI